MELAPKVLHVNGQFDLRICRDAATEANPMGVAGMLAGLQKNIVGVVLKPHIY